MAFRLKLSTYLRIWLAGAGLVVVTPVERMLVLVPVGSVGDGRHLLDTEVGDVALLSCDTRDNSRFSFTSFFLREQVDYIFRSTPDGISVKL